MSEKQYQWIISRTEGAVAEITLDRPRKRNALTDEMLMEVRDALAQADADPVVRVIVLSGAGGAFSAGFDVSPDGKKRSGIGDWEQHFSNASQTFRAIWDLSTPVIAKIDGPCLGGGFDMVMACDMAIASDRSIFGEPEVLFAGTCMFMLLPWLVNTKACKQILLTGDTFGAEQALKWDLINQVVPREELDAAVARLVDKMVKIPLGTLPYNKRLINRTYELMHVREAMDLSREAAAFALATKSGEALEFDRIAQAQGLKAALAWRDQRFKS